MQQIVKSIIMRFVRGGLAGAVASMLSVSPTIVNNYNDLGVWLNTLLLAGFVGFVSGSLLAIDKAVRIE